MFNHLSIAVKKYIRSQKPDIHFIVLSFHKAQLKRSNFITKKYKKLKTYLIIESTKDILTKMIVMQIWPTNLISTAIYTYCKLFSI